MAHKPANVTFEQAAAVPDGAVSALTCLRRAGVRSGRHVLRSRHALKAGGVYVSTDGLRNIALAPISRLGSRRVALPIARARKDDVLLLKQLLEDGEYRAVIDRSYPLEDIVDASRCVETQQKTGNVVLTVSGDRKT